MHIDLHIYSHKITDYKRLNFILPKAEQLVLSIVMLPHQQL